MKKYLATLAIIGFALALKADAQTLTTIPASWNLTWSVHGGMVGPFDVGISFHGQPPSGLVAQPPVGANCHTTWSWRLPLTGVITTDSPYDCSEMKQELWDISQKPHSAPASAWVVVDTFTLHDVAPDCCNNPPPQHCSGEYTPGILSGPCL